METAISGLVLSQIYWPKQPLEHPVLSVGAGTRLATAVAMTTTTSGPCLFTAHLSSFPAKFVSFLRVVVCFLLEDCREEEEGIQEPGTPPTWGSNSALLVARDTRGILAGGTPHLPAHGEQ